MVVIDNIAGEVIEIYTKYSAIKFAENRLKYHNSEFTFKRHNNRRKAVMSIVNDRITIDYENESEDEENEAESNGNIDDVIFIEEAYFDG